MVNFTKNRGVNIYPNPANGFINIDLRKYEGKTAAVYFYNALGYLLKKTIVEKATTLPQSIDIQNLTTVTYLVRLQSEGKRDVVKQVVVAE